MGKRGGPNAKKKKLMKRRIRKKRNAVLRTQPYINVLTPLTRSQTHKDGCELFVVAFFFLVLVFVVAVCLFTYLQVPETQKKQVKRKF